MIVDKNPLGVGEELRPTLDWLRRKGRKSALVVRDILDEPSWTREAWQRSGQYAALSEYYEAAWVLGDPTVYATAQMYGLDETGVDCRYAGYLGRPSAGEAAETRRGRVLVTVGGGEDGASLIERVAEALPDDGSVPADIVFGPYFPTATRERVAARFSDSTIRCIDYVDDLPRRIRNSAGVVSMGGYNTVCEILSAQVPALVIPRTRPAREQQIRAQRMSALGFFNAVDPDTAEPHDLTAALRDMVETDAASWKRPDMDGVARVTSWALGV
jgi:predicted glycosyltransferase